MVNSLIAENARVAQDQDEYAVRYEASASRFEATKAKYEKVTADISAKGIRRREFDRFIKEVEKLPDTVLKLKAPFRYRAQSLGIAAFSSEYKVLFDTFSFKKKYEMVTEFDEALRGSLVEKLIVKEDGLVFALNSRTSSCDGTGRRETHCGRAADHGCRGGERPDYSKRPRRA